MARAEASRISKRPSPKITRSRSKMSSAGASGGVLERMIEEAANAGRAEGMRVDDDGIEGAGEESDGGVPLLQQDVEMASQMSYEGKGKGKMAAFPAGEASEGEGKTGWIEDKPFRLFDLPTEIRLEIYRACLTRPYKILLSKPTQSAPKPEEHWNDDSYELPSDAEEEAVHEFRDAGVDLRPSNWLQQATRSGQSAGTPVLQSMLSSSRRRAVSGSRGSARPTLRMSSSSSVSQSSASSVNQTTPIIVPSANSTTRTLPLKKLRPATLSRPRMEDPLIVNLLRTTKTVYKEARDVLYSENIFSLDISTAVTSLAALHQRSRRRIKFVELEIPTYTEILESFSETVRLSLRYCFGLRRLVIHTPFTLPGGEGSGNSTATGNVSINGYGAGTAATHTTGSAGGNTTVYANGFDILRWLPQGCEVVLAGQRNLEIDAVVGRHMRLAGVQDKLAYARRQLISNDADSSV